MRLIGLSKRQRELADMIWAQQSREELHIFLDSLENDRDKRDCTLLLKLMMLELIDEQVDEMQEFPFVNDYLRQF
jgi:hypothetical protein